MNIDPKLYDKYTKEQIDEAVQYLSYKEVTEMPKYESNTQPTLYIFRHGQSEDNELFVFSGWRDAKLTQKGVDQALNLAEKLKNKKIDMLISSPQIRAIDTMKYAMSKNQRASELEINTDPRIKERSYGIYQGKSKLEMQLEDPEGTLKLRRSFNESPKDGESLSMVCMRVRDFCTSIVPMMKKYNISVAVSCHGNSIRGFRKYFENLSEEETTKMETPLAQDYLAYIIN